MLVRAMRTHSIIGALCLLGWVGCAEEARDDEPAGSFVAPFSVGAEGPLVLWQVRLEGPCAADVWLEAGPGERALRSRTRLDALAREHRQLRPVVESHGTIIGELTRVANGFLVLTSEEHAARLGRVPGVVEVARAPLHRPTLASAVPVIGAPTAWTGVNGVHGEGIRIGIIDSGIDYVHADFGGSGEKADYDANDGALIEPGTFPTARVVGGWDFVGDAYDASDAAKNTPAPDADPLDCKMANGGAYAGGHGTHVAGIAAGNGVTNAGLAYDGTYDATLTLGSFAVAPGVAPRALLVALRVFGCGGSTGVVPLALERAADPNLDGDFSDRLDVVNMSLGSSYGLGAGLEIKAVQTLFKLGTLLVVAAGNDGDTFFNAGAPGTLRDVMTVAATEDRPWVPLHVESPASVAGTYPAAEGPISTPLWSVGTISGMLARPNPANGCAPFSNLQDVVGRVALIDRGNCPFITKLGYAREAGALAVVVVDDQFSAEPFIMGGEGSVDLPAVLIRREDGKALEAELDVGVQVRLVGSERYRGPGAEPIAGFSSRGPSIDNLALKPDVSTPGSDILSAKVGSGTEGVVMQGTSMACPMAAGAAALTRQAHPDLGPGDIKARLVNTAVPQRASNGEPFALTRQGAGRLAVDAAVTSKVTVKVDGNSGDTAISFGALVAAAPMTSSASATVENRGATPLVFALSTEAIDALPGVDVTVTPSSLTLAAGNSATFEVTLAFDPVALGAPAPDALTPTTQFDFTRHYLNEAMGHVRLDAAETTLRLPYYAVLRAAAERHAGDAITCDPNQRSGDFVFAVDGPSAHPAPVTGAFELGTLDDKNPTSAGNSAVAATDLRAVGIASNFGTKGAIDETTVFFAVAVSGPWATPAPGQFAPIGIHINSDDDNAFEWTVQVAPFTKESPYADVLVVVVTNAKGEAVGDRRFVNIVPRDEADTAPFVNQVLVLPVFARDIGVTAEKTTFRYSAFADRLETPFFDDTTSAVEYDVARPKLDSAVLAPKAGRPLFFAGEPIRVRVDGDALGDGPMPSVLLTHHNNVLGATWEVVPLDTAKREELTLTIDTRPSAGRRVVRKVTLSNLGSSSIPGVDLTGSFTDGEFILAAPSQGSCVAGTISCAIGDLGPGKAATVTLEFDADGDLPIELQTTTKSGCVTKTSRTIERVPLAESSRLGVSGGCACEAGGRRDQGPVAWLVAALGTAFVARGRRRR